MKAIFAVMNTTYLCSSEKKAWKKIQACTGFEPMTSVIPGRPSFHLVFITAKITFIFTSLTAVQIYDPRIHNRLSVIVL